MPENKRTADRGKAVKSAEGKELTAEQASQVKGGASVLLPRVGWEITTAFNNGAPDQSSLSKKKP